MIASFSNWIILFPVAFSLFVALRLTEGSQDAGRRTVASLILRAVLAVCFLFAFLSIGLRASLLSIVWIVMLLAFGIVLVWKNQRLDRSAFLLTVLNAQNASQRQAVVHALHEGNHGFTRRRAAALARDFSDGLNWVYALELRGIAKTTYEKLAVRQLSRYGPSGESDARNPLQIEQEVERIMGRLLIFSWVLLLVPIVGIFMAFIVPTFEEMFQSFALELSPVMRIVIDVSSDFLNFGWTSLFSLVPILVVGLLLTFATLWLFPRLTHLPVIRWFFGDYFRNVGFSALARATEMEPGLEQSCYATAELVPLDFVAARYRSAGRLLSEGQNPENAFLAAGLLSRREVHVVAHELESSNPTWGLQQLANWKVERMLRRYSIIVQYAVVIITLLLGVIVGGLAIGVLHSLAILITQLT